MLSTVFGATGNGNVPTSISELLTARNYSLRGDAILKLPKVNSTKYVTFYQNNATSSPGLLGCRPFSWQLFCTVLIWSTLFGYEELAARFEPIRNEKIF